MIARKMPVTHLLNFLSATRCGSINKASDELHISQPALTRSIKQVEERLGVSLLVRTSSGIVPNDFGKVLLPHLERVEFALQQALYELDALRGTDTRRISFGASPTLVERIIPLALERFTARRPNVTVEFVEGIKQPLLRQLRDGCFDFVIMNMSNEEDEPEFLQEELFTDRLTIVANRRHPIARQPTVSLHDLVQCKWVLPTQVSILRPRLDSVFRKEGLDLPGFAIETASLHVAKQLVLRTDRIAAFPSVMVTGEVRKGSLVALEGYWSFIPRAFAIFFRKGVPLSPIAKELIEHLNKAVRDLGLRPEHELATPRGAGHKRTRMSPARG